MDETKTGKRTLHIDNVQLVEDGDTIEMYVPGVNRSPVIFRKDTGASGPHAYEKLASLFTQAEEQR